MVRGILKTLLHWRTDSCCRFKLLTEQGPFELREYEKMLCAKIALKGNLNEAFQLGIKLLNEYKEGNNFKVDKVHPCGPFFQIDKNGIWDVGLILPSASAIHTIPKPINRHIQIEEIFPSKVGVLNFNDHLSSERLYRRVENLKKWIIYKGLKLNGPVKWERHFSIFPIPFLERNVIQVEVI